MAVNSMEKHQRDIGLDIMRIVAILFVIYNHTSKGYSLYSQLPASSPLHWIYLFITSMCGFAVPLFFMVSGALLLDRNESLKTIWGKRIPRMLLILIAISMIYYLKGVIASGSGFNIFEFLRTTYQSYWSGHLWYIYLYIAYLIGLPIICVIARNLPDRYFGYWIAISIFFSGILPAAEYLLWGGSITLYGNARPAWLYGYFPFYPCIGYFLYRRVGNRGKDSRLAHGGGILCILWILVILSLCAECGLNYMAGKNTGDYATIPYAGIFTMFRTIVIFMTAQWVSRKIEVSWHAGICRLINELGECTFGVYLLHMLGWNSSWEEWLYNSMISLGWNRMLIVWILCLIIAAGCYAVTFLLRKIPVVRKFL